MDVREGETVEFKREMNSGAVKTVIAFANTDGGTLYIGVDDEGVPVGVDDVDAEMTRVTSRLRDSVKPDILMMVSVVPEVIDGRDVIAVHVGRGVRRPYYLASKGPRPEGVYIRSGAASVPASDSAIIRMIRECDGDAFEARLSMNQDLTFRYAQAEFERKGLPLGPGEMRTLGILNPDGVFTNLGLLLSDQCPPTMKAAAFSDDSRSVFTERREYAGSILKQLADAYAFLQAHNHYRTEFSGLERIDWYDYPAVALREALVNSVAHREYALSGPTLVSVMPSAVEIVSLGGLPMGIEYEDLSARISMPRNRALANVLFRLELIEAVMPSAVEIVSLGGLPMGIEYEDLSARISMPRNRALANVLFRLELIEAYGTGIGRMRESYEGEGLSPEITVTANTFSIVLPNRNAQDVKVAEAAGSLSEAAMCALADGARTRAEVQASLGVSQSTAGRILADLVSSGRVTRIGSGRGTRYRLP